MRGPATVLLSLLVLALVAGLPAGTPAAAASPEVGVGVTTLFDGDGIAVAGASSKLDELAGSGLTVARADAAWAAAEPYAPRGARHVYTWDRLDAIAAALAVRGVRWLPVVGYSTAWSTSVPGTDKAPPRDLTALAAYATALAARYGPDGAFWRAHPELPLLPVTTFEVWNEPNIPAFWRPGPDAAGYGALYAAVRTAIHAVQPTAEVLVGGLSPQGIGVREFLRGALAAMPDPTVDGVALHPYGRGAGSTLGIVAAARADLVALGVGTVPISVTEVGWPLPNRSPTATFALPDRTRAAALALVVDGLAGSDCGVERLLPFTWSSAEADPVEQEDWFGLVHRDGSFSAGATALVGAAARAAATPPTAPDTRLLPVCGDGAHGHPAPPLALGLTLTTVTAPDTSHCVTAHVSYRGDPVNGVEVVMADGGDVLHPQTDDDGDAVRCVAAGHLLRARAAIGGWAASPLVQLRA